MIVYSLRILYLILPSMYCFRGRCNNKRGHKKCSCGKNNRSGQRSCLSSNPEHSRCPCVTMGCSCTRDCSYKGCNNNSNNAKEDSSAKNIADNQDSCCRCGRGQARNDSKYVSCSDAKRKSKCPCLEKGRLCTENCLRVNCDNTRGEKRGASNSNTGKVGKRSRTSHGSYKRKRGTEFLSLSHKKPLDGPWNKYETCLLYSTISFMGLTVYLQ